MLRHHSALRRNPNLASTSCMTSSSVGPVMPLMQDHPSLGRTRNLDAIMEALRVGIGSADSTLRGEPVMDRPWPVVVILRGSEVSQTLHDNWLHVDRRAYLGPRKELGVRAAKYIPGGSISVSFISYRKKKTITWEGSWQAQSS